MDPVAVANELGLKVYNATFADKGIHGLIAKRPSNTSIYVNVNDRPVRKRFTVAHEEIGIAHAGDRVAAHSLPKIFDRCAQYFQTRSSTRRLKDCALQAMPNIRTARHPLHSCSVRHAPQIRHALLPHVDAKIERWPHPR
ncbi:ImmA/IrrE family metallo-endopeptidase [Shinella sp. M31]|uniref:ImmA/IrrE family metallo-endopeptidase n=1 Tax=Shinella sp. M31 TaxID=3368615 RepID=UPI003B9F4BD5